MTPPTTANKKKEELEAIAFQSNLLALSAAVEAANSEESETGCNMATAELRHLAQTAKETASLLEESAVPTPPRPRPLSG